MNLKQIGSARFEATYRTLPHDDVQGTRTKYLALLRERLADCTDPAQRVSLKYVIERLEIELRETGAPAGPAGAV